MQYQIIVKIFYKFLYISEKTIGHVNHKKRGSIHRRRQINKKSNEYANVKQIKNRFSLSRQKEAGIASYIYLVRFISQLVRV